MASQARWARSEEHYVLQCFSAFRDSFDARYKAKRGSKLFASQDSRHVCSETGFHAHHVEGNRGRCAAKQGSKFVGCGENCPCLQRNGVPMHFEDRTGQDSSMQEIEEK